ncbi:TPA: hypothetical protein REU56_002954, partial [Listeria monocytogenes]|nr:hypothetical protein [Listeria monocytogenes]
MDPEWYATSGARSLPFTLSMIVPGLGGAKAGVKAAELASKWTKLPVFEKTITKQIMGALGASAVTTPMEAASEAANVYDQALKDGHDAKTAHGMA